MILFIIILSFLKIKLPWQKTEQGEDDILSAFMHQVIYIITLLPKGRLLF